jgi:hypothetical protein
MSITTERSHEDADPSSPLFLKGITSNSPHWNSTVLPYIRHLTFTIASTTDVFFVNAMLSSGQLPNLFKHVTKVNMSGFHWFSGITEQRHRNPYLMMAVHLPALAEVSFTLGTASVTTSKWNEHKMIDLERNGEYDKAKERKALSVRDVAARYDLRTFLQCRSLTRICLEYIVSNMMSVHVDTAAVMHTVNGVRDLLQNGFAQQGQAVNVEMRVVD